MNPPDPLPNVALLEKIYDHIVAHPEEWMQNTYVGTKLLLPDGNKVDGFAELHDTFAGERLCASAFCVAGHAAFMTGATPIWDADESEFQESMMRQSDGRVDAVDAIAQEVLGLTDDEASNLFYGGNSLGMVREVIDKIKERAHA